MSLSNTQPAAHTFLLSCFICAGTLEAFETPKPSRTYEARAGVGTTEDPSAILAGDYSQRRSKRFAGCARGHARNSFHRLANRKVQATFCPDVRLTLAWWFFRVASCRTQRLCEHFLTGECDSMLLPSPIFSFRCMKTKKRRRIPTKDRRICMSSVPLAITEEDVPKTRFGILHFIDYVLGLRVLKTPRAPRVFHNLSKLIGLCGGTVLCVANWYVCPDSICGSSIPTSRRRRHA
uniref:Putative secreted protein n=1 Tax=Ixodes scapularis TaxID=6945 RepID=A0A4D5RBW2_IXOSC